MEKSRIKLPMDIYDWIISLAAVIFTILLIGYPILYYPELPDILPSHFNLIGEPDSFSEKNVLWILPVTGTFIFLLISLFIRKPQWGNYLIKITNENQERQYLLASKFLRTIRMIIACLFFTIIFYKINIGLGNQDAINKALLPIFLISIFGSVGIYFYKAYGKK